MKRHLLILIILAILNACANRSSSLSALDAKDGDLPFNPRYEPFDADTKSTFANSLSNGSGGMTANDREALKRLFAETDAVNTNDELARLSTEIQNQILQIQEEERRTGTVMAGRRIALMQSAMQDCTNRAQGGAPKPGQPLQGRWEGKGCASSTKKRDRDAKKDSKTGSAISILIAGEASPNRFPVSGGTSGVMGAQKDGTGVVSAQPWSGQLSDQSFTGVLSHPTYQRKNDQDYPCAMEVGMRASTNPIPENHVLAMKIVGKCLRTALYIANPAMDGSFKKMDPALMQLLQNRMLGIKGKL